MRTYLMLAMLMTGSLAWTQTNEAPKTEDLLSQMERSEAVRESGWVTELAAQTDGNQTVLRVRDFIVVVDGVYEIPAGTHMKIYTAQDNHWYLKTALIEKTRVRRFIPVEKKEP